MKNRSALFILLTALSLVALSIGSVSAQEISLNGALSTTGNAWGKGGKPKPTPSPDGESDWNGTVSSDFNTAGNWTAVSGSAPPTTGDVGWLKSTPANKSINLSSSVSIAGLYFNGTGASGYSITSSNTSTAFTLTASGSTIGTETSDTTAVAIGAENTSGTNTISAPITLAPSTGSTSTISQATGGTLTISGVISGSGITLDKTSGGTLVLSGANTYSGGTTVDAGIVQMSGSGTLGSTSSTLTMSGGNLQLNGTNQTVGALNGSGGTISNDSNGASTSTLTVGSGDTSGSFSGTITDHGGLASGTVALIKTGSGTQTMTSTTSNYTGGTTINGGTLISNSSNGGALGTGPIAVNSGGTLAGAQTIDSAASISVNSGGTLRPGTTASSGSFAQLNTGALTLAANSTLALDINGGTGPSGTGAGTLYDQVNVTGNVSIAGSLSLTLGNTALSIGDKFFIILYSGSESGAFSNTTNGGLTYTQGGDIFAVDYLDGDPNTESLAVSLTLVAVPEPSTWIAGALAAFALGYVLRRRYSLRRVTV
jgi:autotransporter-associated beta strand protein